MSFIAITLRAVRDGDAGALLAAVLERIEAEVGEPRDVAVVIAGRVVDAEDAAHQRSPSLAERPRDGALVERRRRRRRRSAAPATRCARRRRCRPGAARASPASSLERGAGARARPRRRRRPSPSVNGSPGSGASTPIAPRMADSAIATASPPSDTSCALSSSPRSAAAARSSCRPALAARSGSGMRPSVVPSITRWYAEPSTAAGPSPATRTSRPRRGRRRRPPAMHRRARRRTPTTGVGWIGRPWCSL